MRKWLEQEYLAIRESARRYQAQIHWLDEMDCVRTIKRDDPTDDTRPNTCGLGTGQRFRCNMISAITSIEGVSAFSMLFRQRFATALPGLPQFSRLSVAG